MTLDISYVRAQFPALSDGFAYFDNAGGSLVLQSVADRVRDYLLTTSVQTGASYSHSLRASAMVSEARARVALMMGARRPEEVVLGTSTTVLLQLLARGMLRQLSPGDEIIVTNFDHESNIAPWRWLEHFGIVIREWGIKTDTLEPSLDDLARIITARTRLVAVTHVSNLLGTIFPIAAIARLVHSAGAEIVVDGVAFAPHRMIDVVGWDVDYYAFSFYKTFGPHCAALYGKYEKLQELDGPYDYLIGKTIPTGLEFNINSYELAWGAAAIVDYLDVLGGTGGRPAIERAFDDIASHEVLIGGRLLDYLRLRNDVSIIGRHESDQRVRVPTISFKPVDRDAGEIVRLVDGDEVGIRNGDFLSRRLVDALDLRRRSGVVRVSMTHYNSVEEVDRLIHSLDRALG